MIVTKRNTTVIVALALTVISVYQFSGFNEMEIYSNFRRQLEEVAEDYQSPVVSQEFETKRAKFCTERALRIKVIGADQPTVPSQYPQFLCDADNSLKHGSLPGDWSACYRSRLGESVYDVIVLDYFEVANQDLVDLAIRTRLRFPYALIVNLKHWYPIWTGYQSQGGWENVAKYAADRGYPNMTNEALVVFNQSTLNWEMQDWSTQQKYYDDATKRSQAWTFFKGADADSGLSGRAMQDLTYRRSFMFGDWDYRNGKGDWDVSNGIFDLFEHLDVKRNDTVHGWFGNDDHSDCFM